MERAFGRRGFLRLAAASGVALACPRQPVRAQEGLVTRAIPSSGEAMPVVGLGSWITFNVGDDPTAQQECAEVMAAFFDAGGRMIDSSPMYGSAQAVIGHGLKVLGMPRGMFAADKVWISSGRRGPAQIEESRGHWGVPRFDLLQVHNLLAWEEHLPALFDMKTQGKLRYVGITTSEGRRHAEFERVMQKFPLDFIQVTYNPLDREVEARILPLAQERGMAVIANRPFRQGDLTRSLERIPLPGWAVEIDCRTWAQAILKYIAAHPAITCAIPATTRVDHVRENMAAARHPLPDKAMRERIAADLAKI